MPTLEVSPELEMYYETDSFVEPWVKPESLMLLHGCAESGIVWYDWMPHLARHFNVVTPRHARLRALDAHASRFPVEPRRHHRRLHEAHGPRSESSALTSSRPRSAARSRARSPRGVPIACRR